MDYMGRIKYYFEQGYTQRDIIYALHLRDGCDISQRHLRRLLAKMRLFRKTHFSDFPNIVEFIHQELQEGSSELHGYRFMHRRCLQEGLVVSRDVVRQIIAHLDPDGVALRKRKRLVRRRYYAKGPNYVWHLDSYDKLKPYGIGINGCIDGFSRKMIWVEAFFTNSDPKIIAGYFASAVAKADGCPMILRTDKGTENVTTLRLQQFFRENDHGIHPHNCVILGKSTANTRIESWWGRLRRGCTEYWISKMHKLQSDGDFSGDDLDKELVRFCYLSVIQVMGTFIISF